MQSNWHNFLKNLGEWHGSFTVVSLDGELLSSTPSILNLEASEDNTVVRFRLRRYGPNGYEDPPISDYSQDYTSLGQQVVFFSTGAFSKGSLQLAPFSEFGAEYGFVSGDRRLRFVQLYSQDHALSSLILIREFRSGTEAYERPPLTVEQLLGHWHGTASTVYANWQPSDTYTTHLEIKKIDEKHLQQILVFKDQHLTSTARIQGNSLIFEEGSLPRKVMMLPDGTSSNTPLHLKLRHSFFVELGWLVTPTERQRLMRSYNEKGEWISATHIIESKIL
jgi:hypothetical protein